MKKNIPAAIIFFAVITFFSEKVLAQRKLTNVPVKGNWQLVSNINEKKIVTVQFYSDDKKLMYEETLKNVRLNIKRKKVINKLNQALNETYQIWTITHTGPAVKDFVAKIIN